jgi:NADP-reducing hydrogenase subunit HndA
VFMLKRVRCVGSCSLAPVVRVDADTFGRLSPANLDGILAKYRDEEYVKSET